MTPEEMYELNKIQAYQRYIERRATREEVASTIVGGWILATLVFPIVLGVLMYAAYLLLMLFGY